MERPDDLKKKLESRRNGKISMVSPDLAVLCVCLVLAGVEAIHLIRLGRNGGCHPTP